jgi:hypothetical protein
MTCAPSPGGWDDNNALVLLASLLSPLTHGFLGETRSD